MRYLNVFITVPDKKTADKIIKETLNKKIVSCISIVEKINSFYWWRGKIENSKERLLIMKTTASKFKLLENAVKKNHAYQVPEIAAFEITKCNRDYLKWIDDTVKKG
ncbi:MAG: divalent-cation tolerance protein CutA [Elusimicrobiota bacterium]|jgi:periplasmic divalent cation tolerance protein|nr:divalent-cation tolerance protein CutA [Elusimicrobiota bacterium]